MIYRQSEEKILPPMQGTKWWPHLVEIYCSSELSVWKVTKKNTTTKNSSKLRPLWTDVGPRAALDIKQIHSPHQGKFRLSSWNLTKVSIRIHVTEAVHSQTSSPLTLQRRKEWSRTITSYTTLQFERELFHGWWGLGVGADSRCR